MLINNANMNTLLRLFSFITVLVLLFSCKKKVDSIPELKIWQKSDLNPVLKKGVPINSDFYAISDCWVMKDNGVYKMWYTGGGPVSPDTILHSNIGYAWSVDGISWIKEANNPVLDISKTAWDSSGVETVTVIIDNDAPAIERYKMWYAGQTINAIRYDIGYAYSADGIQWTKHPGAVITVGISSDWDNAFIEGPSVIKDGNVYKMWYAGYDAEIDGQSTDGKASIGYATSVDGINWTKYFSNPVLKTGIGMWDAVYVQDPHVVKYNNLYHMWYGGVNVYDNYYQQTGYAYSVDGINWVKSTSNPILKRGSSGTWDANTASFPSVIIEGDKLKMWYTGKDVEPLPTWPNPYFWEIGYAEKNMPVGQMMLD